MAQEASASMAIKLSELLDAYAFADLSGGDHAEVYICRQTGKIIFIGDGIVEGEEELSEEDVFESDQYEAVPNRRELDLGRALALSFVADRLPAAQPKAREIFSRKGAYARFKQLLVANGVLDDWYAFEQSALEEALRDWCEDVGITLIED